MPHIILEYSKNLGEIIEISKVIVKLHETLAEQGIDKKRIKSRAISLNYVAVGEHGMHGHMMHATLLLLEGRDDATKQKYGQALFDVMKDAVDGVVKTCPVTLEVRDMAKASYFGA